MMRRTIGKSIFTKLLGCFLVFPVLLITTALLCLLLTFISVSSGNIENLFPYSHVDSEGNVHNLEDITVLGGWIEELDSDYQIVQVYGDKQNTELQYTQNEIYDFLAVDGDNALIGFLYRPEHHEHYFLCLYQRSSFELTLTLQLNNNHNALAYRKGTFYTGVFFVLMILEVLLISLYLRRKIKAPLKQLTEGMERIQSGEEHVILNIKTEAEFEQIVNTFNTMTQKLEQEKQENQRIVSQKNQLLLELSHDLRTPIATIKSYASALEDGLVPEEKRQSYYRTINRKTDRVQQLAEDMFFMLKMDNPKTQLALEETDICEFLRTICAEFYDEIQNAGFHFVIDIPEHPIMVDIDRRLIFRVIGNLLANARRYNQSGSEIGVRCEIIDNHVQIQVSDDGTEIDSDLATQMFRAFVRGDATRKSDGGMGLGLSISKIIIEKHKGEFLYKRDDGRNVFIIVI